MYTSPPSQLTHYDPYMSHSHRAPSPYRSSPNGPPATVGATLPTGPATVGPGSVTYATETGPDGSIIYQPYRRSSLDLQADRLYGSYHTPAGLVSGIQWVKADPESLVKQGVDPIEWNANVQTEAWQRGEDERSRRDKNSSRRHRDVDGRNARDDDDELRKAREWDAQSVGKRDRRKSFGAGSAQPPNPLPTNPNAGYGGYPTHPSNASSYAPFPGGYNGGGPVAYSASGGSTHGRQPSTSSAYGDLAQRMENLDLDRKKDYGERERRMSHSSRHHPSEASAYERKRTVSGNYGNPYPTPPGAYPGASSYGSMGPPANPYPPSQYAPSPHMRPGEVGHGSSAYAPSPNMRPGEVGGYGTSSPSGYPGSSAYGASPSQHPANIGRSTTPFGNPPQVYPRGHVLEGQPLPPGASPLMNSAQRPRSRAPSRAPSPNPAGYRQQNVSGSGRSPHIPATQIPGDGPQQLPAPEAFSRPLNMANSFVPFETAKVRDMDDIYDTKLPKMPPALATHDIYPEDWQRCMQDLGRAWEGQLPVPSLGAALPRRSILAADLVDLWNDKFFYLRGVELRLYKGKEKRTGKNAGMVEKHLPGYDDDDDYSSSTGSSSDVEFARRNPYGRDVAAEKEEKKRRRKERRAKRRAKTYAVYIACLSRPAAPTAGYGPMPGGYGVAPVPAPYGYPPAPPMGYGANLSYSSSTGYPSAGYGHASGVPASRSQGYGGGY
ncbi:hypothetical protein D9619_001021 [Psilocybe cf. subviscida]|uniref:Uncharacterized protein n=1 Tax=Psilocybe cf. subviscida TaxID=2480587 RepID=A0A8H5BEV8_9AGAR|nr:hypothetical protein D9619_001021 [Psilocybe cf. subviscida]